MPTRRASRDHDDAVARRLQMLDQELGIQRADQEPPPWWDEPTRVATRQIGGAGRRDMRPALRVEDEVLQPPGSAPHLPVPGRHAARHPRTLIPRLTRPDLPFGAAHLAVVAVVGAIGLALTAWIVIVGDERPMDLAAARPERSSALVDPAVLETPDGIPSEDGPSEVVVDVAGRVRRPGIAVLPAGSRVVDAIEAAGGARRGVRLTSINLARVLIDGEQILVGSVASPGVAASAVAAPGAPAPGTLINLNSATEAELDLLPQVGPVTAQAIIGFRTDQGGFSSVDQLLEVDGIGEATLARIAPFVTV